MKSLLLTIFSTMIMLNLSSCSKNIDTNHVSEYNVDTLTQRNGNTISYTKPTKSLIVLKRDNNVYDSKYSVRLQKIAEYYIDKNKNSLIDFHKKQTDAQFGYSIEENIWEDVQYTQIGIFKKSGSNVTTLQWLFYQPKTQQLYEFDLHTKKLTLFPIM